MTRDITGAAVILCVLLGGMTAIIGVGVAVMVGIIRQRGGPTRE